MTQPQNKPATAMAPQNAERAVEYQAFGSSEKVQLSINIVRKWLVSPTASGKVASDSDVMKFIMLCKARQLNPWEGDAFLVGYDAQGGPSFSLITAHQAFVKRAEVHMQYDGMESGVIVTDKDGKLQDLEGDFVPQGYVLVGGWAKVYRKDQSHPKIARLNVETFDKQRAQWKTNRAGMIVKCAEADAMRGAFPNTLGGMYVDAEAGLISAGAEPILAPAKPELITEDQRTDLVRIANEAGTLEKLGAIVNAAGFEMLAHITVDKYEDVANAIRTLGSKGGTVVDAEIVDGESDEDEAEERAAIADEANAISTPEEKAKSVIADLQAHAGDILRELKGAQLEAANKFTGTKGVFALKEAGLREFIKKFGGQ
jgi:phage recombination protein Bet